MKDISNIEDLQKIGNDPDFPLYGEYRLTQNIDAWVTSTWNDGSGFDPIAKQSETVKFFTGFFDGCGFSIENLTINRPTEIVGSLFGVVMSGAVIRNLTIKNSTFTALQPTALCSFNNGRIENCVSENNTITIQSTNTENKSAGGLISINGNSGFVDRCSSIGGSVTSASDVSNLGGLIGSCYNESRVVRSYSSTSVIGGNNSGGLIGSNLGFVYDCFSYGSVSSGVTSANLGGLIGYTSGDFLYLQNCYWDKQTSGQLHSSGLDDLYGRTTEEMKTQNNYTGFDFVSDWSIVTDSYPTLKIYETNIVPYIFSTDRTYNGLSSLQAFLISEKGSFPTALENTGGYETPVNWRMKNFQFLNSFSGKIEILEVVTEFREFRIITEEPHHFRLILPDVNGSLSNIGESIYVPYGACGKLTNSIDSGSFVYIKNLQEDGKIVPYMECMTVLSNGIFNGGIEMYQISSMTFVSRNAVMFKNMGEKKIENLIFSNLSIGDLVVDEVLEPSTSTITTLKIIFDGGDFMYGILRVRGSSYVSIKIAENTYQLGRCISPEDNRTQIQSGDTIEFFSFPMICIQTPDENGYVLNPSESSYIFNNFENPITLNPGESICLNTLVGHSRSMPILKAIAAVSYSFSIDGTSFSNFVVEPFQNDVGSDTDYYKLYYLMMEKDTVFTNVLNGDEDGIVISDHPSFPITIPIPENDKKYAFKVTKVNKFGAESQNIYSQTLYVDSNGNVENTITFDSLEIVEIKGIPFVKAEYNPLLDTSPADTWHLTIFVNSTKIVDSMITMNSNSYISGVGKFSNQLLYSLKDLGAYLFDSIEVSVEAINTTENILAEKSTQFVWRWTTPQFTTIHLFGSHLFLPQQKEIMTSKNTILASNGNKDLVLFTSHGYCSLTYDETILFEMFLVEQNWIYKTSFALQSQVMSTQNSSTYGFQIVENQFSKLVILSCGYKWVCYWDLLENKLMIQNINFTGNYVDRSLPADFRKVYFVNEEQNSVSLFGFFGEENLVLPFMKGFLNSSGDPVLQIVGAINQQ